VREVSETKRKMIFYARPRYSGSKVGAKMLIILPAKEADYVGEKPESNKMCRVTIEQIEE
jgi:hypothetical protein